MTQSEPHIAGATHPAAPPRVSGWRGVSLIAITYVYFLIFAQFAFLKRLAELHIADTHLKAVMAAMAFGGILFSLLTPRTKRIPSPIRRLQTGLALCTTAALLTLLQLSLLASIATAFLIGTGLGILTVTLVTHLRSWLGIGNLILKVGLGTGIGYLLCNFPPLFTASPTAQALTATALCLTAIAIAAKTNPSLDNTIAPAFISSEARHQNTAVILSEARSAQSKDPRIASSGKSSGSPSKPSATTPLTFPQALLAFTALIWLDSAAFFIIQNTPTLKAGTWEGTVHLTVNGILHLTAALASVWLLRRRGLSNTLSFAFLALACACLLLLDPHRALLASFFYPIGVSLYSVALVAYPSLLSPASSIEERGRRAGWIYAIGGWFGSAMGIGMGQNLGHIPALFVLLAGIIVLMPQLFLLFRTRRRELLATTILLLAAVAAWATQQAFTPHHAPLTQIERGRQVYISEGCINCHSQYVRPHTADVLLWGPAETIEDLRQQHPPLIGNRRQGPDLSQVGNRRSPLWLKAHFYAPARVSHASFMPSYAYLFRTQPNSSSTDSKGDDLVAYLHSLHTDNAAHLAAELAWHPSTADYAAASAPQGAQLFATYCSTCHTPGGATRTAWQPSFHRLPPVLSVGPIQDISPSASPDQRRDRLAQIVKFGIPGTDMPGHEYLSDRDVASLSLWLEQTIAQPIATSTPPQNGEHP
jgi:cbb3-type cytochrome c oxidase subunit II